jgi:hypothetical protein
VTIASIIGAAKDLKDLKDLASVEPKLRPTSEKAIYR